MYVTLSEVKEWIKVENDVENGTIQTLIDAAEATVNTYCLKEFDASELPKEIPLAIRLYVDFFFNNRSAGDRVSINAMERAFEAMLFPLRDKTKIL